RNQATQSGNAIRQRNQATQTDNANRQRKQTTQTDNANRQRKQTTQTERDRTDAGGSTHAARIFGALPPGVSKTRSAASRAIGRRHFCRLPAAAVRVHLRERRQRFERVAFL